MNIFVLDHDPILAARMQVDKHVVKMCLETSQILCTVASFVGIDSPYKPTHQNRLCTRWVGKSASNWNWTLKHLRGLLDEYTFRYDKFHACEKIYSHFETEDLFLPENGLTAFAQEMPEKYRRNNAVKAYRAYYKGEKYHIASWKRRDIPEWWKE